MNLKKDSHEFIIADLRDSIKVDLVIDEVYQLASDMGVSTYIISV